MRRIILYSPILLLTFAIGISVSAVWSYLSPPFVTCHGNPAPYVVLKDNGLSPYIEIGVGAGISEQELCATMAQVADKHQDEPAREYWLTEYLTIRAYLIKDGERSYFKAGTLYRYIPIRYPLEEAQKDSPREDQVYTNLWLSQLGL